MWWNCVPVLPRSSCSSFILGLPWVSPGLLIWAEPGLFSPWEPLPHSFLCLEKKKLYILLPGSDPAVSACFPWKWNDEIVTAACVKISVIWVLSRLHFITELWPESEQPTVVTAESGPGDTAWSTGYQWWSFETRRNQKSWRMGSLKRWVKSCNISLVIHFNFQSHDYERVSKILVQFTTRGLITNHKMQITLTRSDLIVSSMRQNNFQFYVSIKYWQCFII